MSNIQVIQQFIDDIENLEPNTLAKQRQEAEKALSNIHAHIISVEAENVGLEFEVKKGDDFLDALRYAYSMPNAAPEDIVERAKADILARYAKPTTLDRIAADIWRAEMLSRLSPPSTDDSDDYWIVEYYVEA